MEKPEKELSKAAARALADLYMLRERLKAEGETELLAKINICQAPLSLKCTVCRDQIEVRQRCKRKWCPCCMRQLAAQRSAELGFIVERFRHKLFVTLTMSNVEDLSSGAVRELRRAFGKLRHRQFWKENVTGGVAAIEVTNIGNGWHPHLHCVIDCKWLAVKTPAPARHHTIEEKKALYKRAAQELESNWSKCLKQESSSVKVKRVTSADVAKEVLKYSVTSEALIDSEEPIGDLLRAMESTRLMTTFGRAHGQCVKDVRAAAKASANVKRSEQMEGMEPRCVCGAEEFLPAEIATVKLNIEANRRPIREIYGIPKHVVHRKLTCEAISKKAGTNPEFHRET